MLTFQMFFKRQTGSNVIRIKGVKTLYYSSKDLTNLIEAIEGFQEDLNTSVFFSLDSGEDELTVLEKGDTIDISVLTCSLEKCPTLRVCHPLGSSEGSCCTPTIDGSVVVPKKFSLIIDLLHTPEKENKLCFLGAVEALQSWIDDYITALQDYWRLKKSIFELVPYHFSLNDEIVSVFYPLKLRDEDLADVREELHSGLSLPMDRPYLRRGSALLFNTKTDNKLVSVHQDLKSPPGDRLIATVSGRYTYYHYLQDGAQDNGWGCAYRSLQTIISWFNWQGYSNVKMPNHKEIQKALVKIRDKEAKFIGSKQWIGSIEVSHCLEYFCRIQSKILSVTNGENMSSIARALLMHFETQGTPVMIGGGVLAHTILGIAFDENSGDARYLILDPHYTGPEDLHLITSKGWCGWKEGRFWDEKAHYNLCLPQKPVGI